MPERTVVAPTTLEQALALRRAAMRKTFDKLEAKARAALPTGNITPPAWQRWEALAASLGVSEHTIAHWVRRGCAPRAMSKAIEAAYSGLVSAEELGQVVVG